MRSVLRLRSVLLLGVAPLLCAAPSLAQWIPAGPFNASPSGVYVENRGALVTHASSQFFRSADGGRTWVRPALTGYRNTNGSLPSLYELAGSATSLVASTSNDGGATGLLRSRDGGETWQRITATGYPARTTLQFGLGGDSLVALEAPNATVTFYRLVVSTDGGSTWTVRPDSLSEAPVRHGGALVAPYLLRSPATGRTTSGFRVSEDFGVTWAFRPYPAGGLPGGGFWRDARLVADDTRLLFFLNGSFRISRDRGRTWTTRSLPQTTIDGVALGNGRMLVHGRADVGPQTAFAAAAYVSTDDGATYTKATDPPHSLGVARGTGTPAANQAAPVAFAAGRFFHGSDGGGLISSADGLVWTEAGPMGTPPSMGGLVSAVATHRGRLFAFTSGGNRFSRVLTSADGGATWRREPGFPDYIHAHARGDSALLALATNGLYVSTDGGATWQRRSASSAPMMTWFYDAGGARLYSARYGNDGTTFVSDDHGKTWATRPFPRASLQHFAAHGDRLIGSGPHASTDWFVHASTDGGTTWTAAPDSVRGGVVAATATSFFAGSTSLVFENGQFVYNGPLHRSRDHGATWQRMSVPWGPSVLHTQGTLVLLAARQGVAISADDGDTWRSLPSDPAGYVPTHVFVHRDTVYVAVYNNEAQRDGLYKRGLAEFGIVSAAEEGAGPGGDLHLTVAPQPARGVATVRFVLPQPGSVRAAVYDLLGREVARLHDGPLPAGPHAFGWRDDAAAGVYLVQVAAGGRTATARMMLRR